MAPDLQGPEQGVCYTTTDTRGTGDCMRELRGHVYEIATMLPDDYLPPIPPPPQAKPWGKQWRRKRFMRGVK